VDKQARIIDLLECDIETVADAMAVIKSATTEDRFQYGLRLLNLAAISIKCVVESGLPPEDRNP